MPIGTCDPASRGDAFNGGERAIEQSEEFPRGAVQIAYLYGWDGPRSVVASRTSGSVALLASADAFLDTDAGRAVSAQGIPSGATIAAVSSPTAATLSVASSQSRSGPVTIAGSTKDVAPGCIGPLESVTVTNNTPDPWYVHLLRRRGEWRRITLNPNEVGRVIPKNELVTAGLFDNTDLNNMAITRDPNPPARAAGPGPRP